MDNTVCNTNYLEQRKLTVYTGSDICNTPFKIYRSDQYLQIPDGYNISVDTPPKPFQLFMAGAFYDTGGERIELAKRPSGKADVVKDVSLPVLDRSLLRMETLPVIEGDSLFLGNWMGHYGHFITEFLSRLWYRDNFDKFDRIFAAPFIFGRLRALKKLEFHSALLDSLDISLERIELLVDPVKFCNLTVPEQGWRVNGGVSVHLRPVYSACRDYFSVGFPIRTAEKIFLSRIPGKPYQRLRNLEAIERVFTENGFKVLHPELMDIKAQIQYYSSCKVMAALSGTLAHNCLFTQPGTLMIEVGDTRTRRSLLPMQVAAAQLSEVEFSHIGYSGTDNGILDVSNLQNALRQLGVGR